MPPKGSLQGRIVSHLCPRRLEAREKLKSGSLSGVLVDALAFEVIAFGRLCTHVINQLTFFNLRKPTEWLAVGRLPTALLTMSTTEKKNILITGACGFIASHVCRDLVRKSPPSSLD